MGFRCICSQCGLLKINFSISEFPSLLPREGRLSSQMMEVSPSIQGLLGETKAEHVCSAAELSAAAFTCSATRLVHLWVFVKASWRMYHRGSPCPHNDTPSYKNNPTHNSTPCFCQPGKITMRTCAGADCGRPNFLHSGYSGVVFWACSANTVDKIEVVLLLLKCLHSIQGLFCFSHHHAGKEAGGAWELGRGDSRDS